MAKQFLQFQKSQTPKAKILSPFLHWSLKYYNYYCFLHQIKFQFFSSLISIHGLAFLGEPPSNHYWLGKPYSSRGFFHRPDLVFVYYLLFSF